MCCCAALFVFLSGPSASIVDAYPTGNKGLVVDLSKVPSNSQCCLDFSSTSPYDPKDRVNPDTQLDPKTGKSVEYTKRLKSQ